MAWPGNVPATAACTTSSVAIRALPSSGHTGCPGLEPIVCGAHLDRGFRLAFTMQTADESGDHDRPPGCEGNLPEIDQEQLDAFVEDLRRMVTGRGRSRRRGT